MMVKIEPVAARVIVGIFLPATNHFKLQQVRVNAVEQNLIVGRRLGIERFRIDRHELLLEIVQRRNVFLHPGSRVILKLRVVLVQASARSRGG